MTSIIKNLSRFDTRLPKEQKELFEKAASLGGYRNLTDFILQAVQEKAKEIINANEQLLQSERDNEIFFNEILKTDSKPNESLIKAFERYKQNLNKLIKLPDSGKMFLPMQQVKSLFEK